MQPYVGNIETETMENDYFRKVLYTGTHAQLVVMCVQPGEELGNEVHPAVDQFFRIEQGEAKFVFGASDEGEGHSVNATSGEAAIVPAGTYHNVINDSSEQLLKLYTIYSPPNHPDGTVHETKADADLAEESEH